MAIGLLWFAVATLALLYLLLVRRLAWGDECAAGNHSLAQEGHQLAICIRNALVSGGYIAIRQCEDGPDRLHAKSRVSMQDVLDETKPLAEQVAALKRLAEAAAQWKAALDKTERRVSNLEMHQENGEQWAESLDLVGRLVEVEARIAKMTELHRHALCVLRDAADECWEAALPELATAEPVMSDPDVNHPDVWAMAGEADVLPDAPRKVTVPPASVNAPEAG